MARLLCISFAPLSIVAAQPPDYASIAPIFQKHCVVCHQGAGAPLGLQLDSLANIKKGSRTGAVVIAGVPDNSELIRRIRGDSRPRMPFDGPPFLEEAEIRVISDWVAQGAPDADGIRMTVPVGMRVRLQGRLTGQSQLDGLELVVDSGTRIDKRPRVGDYVEVRGTIRSDGRGQVSRIRRR